MTTKKAERHLRWRPRKRFATQRRTISLDRTTSIRTTQPAPKRLVEEALTPVPDFGDPDFWDKVGDRIGDPAFVHRFKHYIWAGPAPSRAKLCHDYLAARGITDDTVRIHGLECDDRLSATTVKDRLGRGLPKGTLEVIWIPVPDAAGTSFSGSHAACRR